MTNYTRSFTSIVTLRPKSAGDMLHAESRQEQRERAVAVAIQRAGGWSSDEERLNANTTSRLIHYDYNQQLVRYCVTIELNREVAGNG